MCEVKWCIFCDVAMHDGETCAAYQERIAKRKRKREEEDEASERTVRADSKECPHCAVRIQKTEGCDHMTCKLAGRLFWFGRLMCW